MGLWKSLAGTVQVRIISADIESILLALNDQSITLNDIRNINELEVELTLFRKQFSLLESIVVQHGGEVKIIKKDGLYWVLLSLRRRSLLLFGLTLYMILAISLPTRILFVQVAGNSAVSSRTVIEQAQHAGIHFGAPRSAVRSEKVKNALLSAVPELQWIGVNTYGCVAVISVKERSAEAERRYPSGICSISAKCDGVIDEIIVTRGNVLCKLGDAVTENQILVSGYTDCGISIKATSAEAEIYAKTVHVLQLIMPLTYKARTKQREETTKFNIILGKKRIKLYNDSGISDSECVKMYSSNYLTLPGGFVLPVGVIKETLIFYETEDKIAQEETVSPLACSLGSKYLQDSMVAGEILSESHTALAVDDVYKLSGRYFCREMIGKVNNEEIITGDE